MHQPRKCTDCGSIRLVTDYAQGDIVCTNCGLVAEAHIIDERSEWRTFGDKDGDGGYDPSRVGAPGGDPLFGDMFGVFLNGTAIHSNACKNASKSAKKLQMTSRRVDQYDDHHIKPSFAQGLSEIKDLADRLRIVSQGIIRTAGELFEKGVKSDKLRGRRTSAICASCVYIACKHHHAPRTLKEIEGLLPEVSKKDLNHCFKMMMEVAKAKDDVVIDKDDEEDYEDHDKKDVLSMSSVYQSQSSSSHPSGHPAGHMRRFCNDLRVPHLRLTMEEMAYRVKPIAENESSVLRPWDGRSPISIAAGIVYIITQIAPNDNNNKNNKTPITMAQVAIITGVAETTINVVLKDFMPCITDLLPRAMNSEAHVRRIGGVGGVGSSSKKHKKPFKV